MSAIQIVTKALAAAAGVTGITTAGGIYPIDLPQNAKAPPVVLVNLDSGEDTYLINGPGEYYRQRVEVVCLGSTSHDATRLGNAVLSVLKAMINATLPGYVDISIMQGETDVTDRSDDRTLYRRIIHFIVRWRREP